MVTAMTERRAHMREIPMEHPDTGCWAAPKCLICPLETCVLDMTPTEVGALRRRLRAEAGERAAAEAAQQAQDRQVWTELRRIIERRPATGREA